MTAKKSGHLGYLEFAAAPPADVPSVVVVAGTQRVLADEVIATLTQAVLPDESLRALNLDVVDAAAASPTELRAIPEKTAAMPFLAQRRMVVVRGTIDLKKDEREEIAAAAQSVPEHAVLVIDHAGVPDRPQGRRPKEEADVFAAAQRGALLVDCTLDVTDCERYIDRYAARLKVAVDPAARAALAASGDAGEIKNALDRLSLNLKRIRFEDVQEYSLPSADAKLWTLGEAVNAGQTERALRLMGEIVDKPEEAIGPLIWLAGDAQAIWELANGATPQAYAQALGQSPWRFWKLADAARSLPRERAAERVQITMQALERAITGQREKDQALEEVIIRLCAMERRK